MVKIQIFSENIDNIRGLATRRVIFSIVKMFLNQRDL